MPMVWEFDGSASCGVCGSLDLWTHMRLLDMQHCRACGSCQARHRQTTVTYDAEYIRERYDRYPTTAAMSRHRLRVIQSVLYLEDNDQDAWGYHRVGARLLDVGYGNGSFIREARSMGWDAVGNDVNPTPYPHVERVELPINPLPIADRFRVITFYDSLEHFETLDQVRKVAQNTDWIFVSFPRIPDRWLENPIEWKHYRPGEHHFYFSPHGLERLFSMKGIHARIDWKGHPEDIIRGRLLDGQPNIMTCALRCTSPAAL